MIASVNSRVLVDTGPLIAILDERDQHHERCVETLSQIRPPLLTTWPVVTEAAWLLRHRERALQRLMTGEESGLIRLLPLGDDALSELASIAKRFKTLRLQVADMSLVLLAERQEVTTIFTLDRRDFEVVRRKSSRRIVLLPE